MSDNALNANHSDMFSNQAGFDLKAATSKNNSPWARLPKAEVAAVRPQGNRLDTQEMKDLHRKCMGMYLRELRKQQENRAQMAMDEDFYDNIQWSQEDMDALDERGQKAIVYNVIATVVNWIIGTEKTAKTDFKVLARRKDASKAAELKTQLMKYVSDVNMDPFEVSLAFEDAVKAGLGWIDDGAQDDTEGEPVYSMRESWRNVIHDSSAQKLDMSDGRYIFRAKWVDLDTAQAQFPDRANILELAAESAETFVQDYAHGDPAMDDPENMGGFFRSDPNDIIMYRRRVRLIEGWIKQPMQVKKIRGGEFHGEFFDPSSQGQEEDIKSGRAGVVSRVQMRMHCVIFTRTGLIFASESPYRHNRFPLTPIWCYRRSRDNMPYGVIRGLRDIQEDVNKRMSKALAILSMNKTIMDEDAVPDIDEFKEEVARPDAVIVKKAGKELKIEADRDLAPAHLELMSRNIQMIQSVSGVTDENMGRRTNATSGIAITRRQTQGQLSTAKLFENLRRAKQLHGENQLSLIEQFFSEEKTFRITNQRGTPQYITVNDLPENDITRTKADFIVSEDEYRATVREAQSQQLIELLMQLAPVAPPIVIAVVDLLVEKMDIPNREEIVNRIRQATGMSDPDAEEPTPQEIARAQEQQKQAAMQEAMQVAEIEDKRASAAQKAATAARANADAKKIIASIAGLNTAAQKQALESAMVILQAPPVAPVADGILHEAGFRSRTEDEDDANFAQAQAEDAAAAQQEAMAAQQAQQDEQEQAMASQQQEANPVQMAPPPGPQGAPQLPQ